MLLLIFLYTFFISVIVITILALTPAKNMIFMFENKKLTAQEKQIKNLEYKIIFLTRQLKKISSTDQKLKYAIILAGTDSIDSNSAIYDSLRINDSTEVPAKGDILYIAKIIWNRLFHPDSSALPVYFIKPSDGFITRGFQPDKGHIGIDFAAKTGSPVYAASGGVVIFADYTPDDGNTIIIQHDDGYLTKYKHCSVLIVKERDVVVQGELIALSGNSGYKSEGPHLHFELWENGKAVNPIKYFMR